jgi:hypothetical protein
VVGGAAGLIRSAGALLTLASCAYLLAVAPASAQAFVAAGSCRGGLPNGEYELRDLHGQLRVAGALAQGRKTGTFIFWTTTGARIAVIPYNEDARNGTVALWYTTRGSRVEAGQKLAAPYADDRLHGVVRSWYPDGSLRGEYRFEHGQLAEARAWNGAGAALPEPEARRLAQRDIDAEERLLDSLVLLVRDNLPVCE